MAEEVEAEEVVEVVADTSPNQIAHETRKLFKQFPQQGAACLRSLILGVELPGIKHRKTHETPKNHYVGNTETVFELRQSEANELGITSDFYSEVHRLLTVNFSGAVDLSGFPDAAAHTEIMLSGLRARQEILGDLLSAG